MNRPPHYPPEIPVDTIRSIVNAVDPEMILCYGVRSKVIGSWTCFLTPPETERFYTFDLLIITRENDAKKSHEVVDLIGYYNTPFITLTALVHKVTAVIDALKSDSIFFTSVLKSGHLTYEKRPDLFVGLEELSNAAASPDITPGWGKWYELGQQFLKGARFFSSHGVHDVAVFMLHQAIEHTSTALIRAVMGYRPATHNIGRIFDMLENFSSMPGSVFPRNTKEEKDLFNTLSRAYSDVRYEQDFRITSETLSVLLDRVLIFHDRAERFFRMLLKSGQPVSIFDGFEKDLSYENH